MFFTPRLKKKHARLAYTQSVGKKRRAHRKKIARESIVKRKIEMLSSFCRVEQPVELVLAFLSPAKILANTLQLLLFYVVLKGIRGFCFEDLDTARARSYYDYEEEEQQQQQQPSFRVQLLDDRKSNRSSLRYCTDYEDSNVY